MSVQHFAGERSGKELGQGAPRINRDVQTRVVLDAIVSIKTFWIATSAPACFQTLTCNFLCKLCGTFKAFEQDLRLLVPTGTMNEVKTNKSLSARTSPCSSPFHRHGIDA